jgi:hypothetical protein
MICPSCGARNPEGADWCGQCFARFGTDGSAGSAAGRQPATGVVPDAVPAEATARADGGQRDIRVRQGEVEWRCARCGTWSGLDAAACVTCGGPRHGFASPNEDRDVRPVDPRTLIGASLVLPGSGHLMRGATGSGIARMVLWLLWAGAGIALVRRGATGGGTLLLAGAAVLWVTTAVDVSALAAGRSRQLLGARALGALAFAVTAGLLLATLRTTLG